MFEQQGSNKLAPRDASAPRMTSSAQTILVVEDNPGMRTALLKILRANGFQCLLAADHREATDLLAHHVVDLMLLDVMLPGRGGFDICRDLRARGDNGMPIIMVSARGDEADRVAGLELGADDYITKPFSTSELLARIRAVLRRGRLVASDTPCRAEKLCFRGWTLHLRRRELHTPSGARVELSGAEYDLLLALLENAQCVIGRDALLEISRGRIPGSSARSVDVLVCRLRGKLRDDENQDLIRTVRGVGYIFAEPVERA